MAAACADDETGGPVAVEYGDWCTASDSGESVVRFCVLELVDWDDCA